MAQTDDRGKEEEEGAHYHFSKEMRNETETHLITYSTAKKQYDAIWQADADKIYTSSKYCILYSHLYFRDYKLHEIKRRGSGTKSVVTKAQVRAGCTLSGC